MTTLLVRLEDDLHVARVNALVFNLNDLPGIHSVVNVECITAETLSEFLRKPAPPRSTVRPERIEQGVLGV